MPAIKFTTKRKVDEVVVKTEDVAKSFADADDVAQYSVGTVTGDDLDNVTTRRETKARNTFVGKVKRIVGEESEKDVMMSRAEAAFAGFVSDIKVPEERNEDEDDDLDIS